MPIYTCRICQEESPDRSRFITPCQCSGSVKYVHRKCLDKWRQLHLNDPNSKRCEICHSPYIIISESQARLNLRQQALDYASWEGFLGQIIVILVVCLVLGYLLKVFHCFGPFQKAWKILFIGAELYFIFKMFRTESEPLPFFERLGKAICLGQLALLTSLGERVDFVRKRTLRTLNRAAPSEIVQDRDP